MIPGYEIDHFYFYMITNQDRIVFKVSDIFQNNHIHPLQGMKTPLQFKDEKYEISTLEKLRNRRSQMTAAKEHRQQEKTRTQDQRHQVSKEKKTDRLNLRLNYYKQELEGINSMILSYQEKKNTLLQNAKKPNITTLDQRKLDSYDRRIERLHKHAKGFSDMIIYTQSEIDNPKPKPKHIVTFTEARDRLNNAIKALKEFKNSDSNPKKGRRKKAEKTLQKEIDRAERSLNRVIARDNKKDSNSSMNEK
jgi:hypothetical protein